MDVGRLERMRDLLRHDAANPTGVKFDLGGWAGPADGNAGSSSYWDLPEGVTMVDRYYSDLAPIKVDVSCGTAACAFGLAAISGEFAAEGLTYSFMMRSDGSGQGILMPTLPSKWGNAHGLMAAANLFNISPEDTSYFFDPEHYDGTPKGAEGELMVAQRIDDFINGIIDEQYHPGFDSGDDEDED